jgi:GT2 family glycosyltransferase
MDEVSDGKTVSIIIVSWNSEPFIKDAVDTALSQIYNKLEVIVIDNGSTDGTVRVLKRNYSKNKKVKFIFNQYNIGFSAANNQGLYIAKGDFILFLNPDTKLDKNFLKYALLGFDDPKVGAISGKILRFDGKTIDSAGQMLGRNRRAIERGYGRPDGTTYGIESYCFSVCGAAAFYRRETINNISIEGQLFDDNYFAFYEDLDTGWRMNLFGWRCKYIPKAIVYHHRGGSNVNKKGLSKFYQIAAKNPNIQADIIRNRWYTIIKNDHPFNYILHFPWIFLYEIKTIGYLLLFNRKIIGSIFKVFRRQSPLLRKKRKLIKKKTLENPGTIRKRMRL